MQDALVVGVSWPGDIPGAVSAALYLPEDEFNALQAGLPFGRLLRTLRDRLGSENRVAIFAHSLGNMLVHNALKEVPASGADVNFVMNDAAIATEAFEDDFDANREVRQGEQDPHARIRSSSMRRHARNLGYPNPGAADELLRRLDGLYIGQEATVAALASVCDFPGTDGPPPSCTLVQRYREGRSRVASSFGAAQGSPNAIGTTFFTERWRKWRRSSDLVTAPGAWTRFFTARLNDDSIRVFNTYNAEDSILEIRETGEEADYGLGEGGSIYTNARAWLIAQIKTKPYDTLGDVLSPGEGTDGLDEQEWWTLEVPGRGNHWATVNDRQQDQSAIWGDLTAFDPVPGDQVVPSQRERTREWAELSMWFPAMSVPAGAYRSPALGLKSAPNGALLSRLGFPSDGRNLAFTPLGGTEGVLANGTLSHSYLYMRKLAEVWRGYKALYGLFSQ